MARINPDGTYSGRVGNVVYFSRGGKTFMKAYKKPAESNRPAQLIQRAKLTAASSFLGDFRKIIDLGYQGNDTHSSGYQEALEYHMKNTMRNITPEGAAKPKFEVDPELAKISKSQQPLSETCERIGNTVTISWDPTIGAEVNRHFDSLVLVSWQPGKRAAVDYHVGRRDEGTGTTVLSHDLNAPVHLWAFFMNQQKSNQKTKENVSESVYLGEF